MLLVIHYEFVLSFKALIDSLIRNGKVNIIDN